MSRFPALALAAALILLVGTALPARADALADIDAGGEAFGAGDASLAIDLLTRAIDSGELSDVDLGRAHYNRGVVLASMGLDRDAFVDYSATIDLVGNPVEAYLMRGNVLARNGQPEAALEDYDAALRIDPKFATPISTAARSTTNWVWWIAPLTT